MWWQGEADPHTAREGRYAELLRDLIRRMRAAAGEPRPRIILVRVLDRKRYAGVRAAQEHVAGTEPDVVLVSTDGLGWGDSDHLTLQGYREAAERIRAAVPRVANSDLGGH